MFLCRTHLCGSLTLADEGERVKLSGWVEHKRGEKFITIRDYSGSCQLFLNTPVAIPRIESLVTVEGLVKARPHDARNNKMVTGDIEVKTEDLKLLNECSFLPFPLNEFKKTREELRMKYRYVDLRSKQMQHNLRMRSLFLLNIRKFLCERHGFVDVETPTLFRKTPGGAQEYIVPTQEPGKFYSLPQSPQQFKQLLMVGGIDRYMQIARCYRDEGSRPDRQPEFTQLDIEMSFTTPEEIMTLVEAMMIECWPTSLSPLKAPFPRLSYHEAMQLYGSDKPDTRYGCQITDVTSELGQVTIFRSALAEPEATFHVKAIAIPAGCELLTSKQIKAIQNMVQDVTRLNIAVIRIGQDGTWKSPLTKYIYKDECVNEVNRKLGVRANDLVFLCAHSDWEQVCLALGKVRSLMAQQTTDNGHNLCDPNQMKFLWVENFPLFEPIKECNTFQSAHHPFTAPIEQDVELLYSDPSQVRGQHYDLVLNGFEVGGGSIRIHQADMQKYVIENILGEDCSQFKHLIEALRSGCPPHGGIALGLDRLLAVMCQSQSIRDVIAFPKTSEGADPMTGAPCQPDADDLALYNILVNPNH